MNGGVGTGMGRGEGRAIQCPSPLFSESSFSLRDKKHTADDVAGMGAGDKKKIASAQSRLKRQRVSPAGHRKHKKGVGKNNKRHSSDRSPGFRQEERGESACNTG